MVLAIISGNNPVGNCCACDTCDDHGNPIKHVDHYTLYKCQNPNCSHWACEEHLEPCGYCTGCCAEEHGLDSHK